MQTHQEIKIKNDKKTSFLRTKMLSNRQILMIAQDFFQIC